MTKVLFVSSEVYPLSKTGGLGDVAASLPTALFRQGVDIRILVPAYASSMEKAGAIGVKPLATLVINHQTVTLHETRLPGTRLKVWLVDIPAFSQRHGNFYCGPDGKDWPDNADRYFLFCRVAEELAMNRAGLDWQPDIVHANDWQTGLIAPLLSEQPGRPASVFTIHNLAYRGEFPRDTFFRLPLPEKWWHPDKLEFFGKLAFIKGGLVFSDKITTVSPSYAQEIQSPVYGWGLDGLLRARSNDIEGILNGIDAQEWNPATDGWLARKYSRFTLDDKKINRRAMQERFGLEPTDDIPVAGFIGRMVHQKGIDLMLHALPDLLDQGKCQFIALGNGEHHYEQALLNLARQFPGQVAMTAGYSEEMAHGIEAGADIFLMPSAYEPCGLNQMYSLRYGTVPVVHGVGGLRDTIEHYQGNNLATANGFVFNQFNGDDFKGNLGYAIELWYQRDIWQQLQRNGMKPDLSWKRSAQRYLAMYQQVLARINPAADTGDLAREPQASVTRLEPLRRKTLAVGQPLPSRERRQEPPPAMIH